MATGTFLDGLNEWNAKSAVVIKDLALRGDFETASLLSSLRTTANDESLTEEVRLNALTALINRGELLDIPVPPYYPVAFSFTPTQTYVGLHNDLSGLNTGDYWHLTYAQYLSVLNKASISDITFGNLTGNVSDSDPLSDALDLKQDAIPAGSTGQFFGWDGAMRFVSWANLSSKPTTLSGLGISSSDTLFDGRYITQSSILTSYTLGSNAAVSNTDSLVGAIGKLQAQVNSVGSSTGTLNSVGLTMDSTVFSVSPATITGSGGTFNVTFQSKAAKTFFASPNAGSGTPSFRQIVVEDLPTSGVTAGNYGNTTNWPTFTVDSYGRITSVTTQAATSGGTVTSVALSAPVEFIVSGSPVIDDGTLGLSWDSATANYVFAGPSTNVEEVPSFRALVPADIPALAISKITGLQGALDAKMSDSLNTSLIYMGNTSAKAVQSQVAGDLTALWSLVGSTNTATFTIADGAVTYAKFANVPDSALNTARPILLGRFDADQGPMQQMTLTNDFTLSEDGIIGLASPNPPALTDIGDLLTSTGDNNLVRLPVGASGSLLMPYNNGIDPNPGLIWGNVGGDISYTVNTDATPYGEFLIGDNKVTLGQMALADAFSIIGNDTSSAATPVYLNKTQATTLINSFNPSSDLPGLVPNGSGNDATYYLDGTGNWSQPGGGGGGGGTVTSVSVVSANGFAGTVANATTTPAITLNTTVTGLLKGNGTAISAATSGTDYAPATSGASILYGNGAGGFSSATIGTGLSFSTGTLSNTGVTSVGLTMPSAFSVSTPNPITTSGTFAVTGAGTVSQYIRGDGSLATFPTSGGAGSGVNYYLNGSVTPSPAVAGYNQMSRVANTGAAANFTVNNTTGFALMAQFVTDANDPALLNIPAGAWDFNFYFSSSNNTANPQFYVDLLKYDGTTFTPIATGIASAETITNGTTIDLYTTSISVPSTVLTLTDRLVIRVYVDTDGSRTITFYTQGTRLAEVFTTFTTGLTALNGLTAQVQSFANGSSGTAPAFVSSTATHTLNIPLASASSVTAGLISKAEYDTFNGKLANVLTTTGDIIYSSSGTTAMRLGIGTTGQVLSVVGGIPAWSNAGTGDVVSNTTSTTTGNFAVFADGLGKTIGQSAGASLSAAGVAVFNASLALGVAGPAGTTGQLLFRNSANAFTTTLQASTSASASVVYTLPSADGVSGQVLRTNGSGTLSWVNTGPNGNKYISTTTSVTIPAATAFGLFVSILIPANTFGSGDIFRIVQRTFRPASTPGAATMRMGFNTANSTSGAGMVWLVGSASSISAATFPGTIQRHISIDGTTTTFSSLGWGTATNDDIAFATSSYSQTTAIDWTVNQYLIIGASTGSGVDSLTSYFLSVSPLS